MFLPENIDLANAEKYILTIRISPDAFSVMIQDSTRYENYTYQHTTFSGEIPLIDSVQRIVFDNNFLTDNFKQVNVVFVSANYMLIPAEFHNPLSVESIYNFTRSNSATHVVESKQNVADCKCIFEVNDDVYLFLVRSLSSPHFYHHSSLVLTYLQARSDFQKCNSLYVNFHANFADIVSFDKKSNLIQMRSYFNEEDINIAYYALSMWEKYKLDQYSDSLYIYGPPPENDIISDIKRYVKEVNNIGLIDQINDFGERAENIPLDILILLTNENN